MAISNGPLHGIRILDLTQAHAGPFGTMLLGDLGAEIIRIEPPTGDMTRMGETKMNMLLYYPMALGRNKKSIVLDMGSEVGKQAFYDLVKISDVVISNYRPGVSERLGVDYETLKGINPKVIRSNISGYGETGPYALFPSYDIIACGQSGLLSLSGEPGRSPVIPGGIALADMLGGTMAAFSTLAALVKRSKDGIGMPVQTSLLDCLMTFQQVMFQMYFSLNKIPGPQGNRHPIMAPYGIYPTKDGFITFGPSDSDKIIKLIGLESILEDERFKNTLARIMNRVEFEKLFEEALLRKTTQEWLVLLRDENDIACGAVLDYPQVTEDPQVKHNQMILEMELNGEKYKTIGPLFKMPGVLEGKPEPPADLGQHTEAVLKELLGYSESQIEAIKKQNEDSLPELKKRLKKL
ncbi:caib/baif family protein [hydrocarbon metagenome]|uniref:Caib/baif family protein n=1 Tax=hydrocarbon metagenome TaxID=938273 RepID=A0A0W8FU32_9ZZZZ